LPDSTATQAQPPALTRSSLAKTAQFRGLQRTGTVSPWAASGVIPARIAARSLARVGHTPFQ